MIPGPTHSELPRRFAIAARLAQGLLVASTAWGAFAFGAVYPWAYWPLVAAAVVFVIAVVAVNWTQILAGTSAMAIALLLFALAVVLQLIPLGLDQLQRVSPRTFSALAALEPAVAMGVAGRHSLSIAPFRTGTGLALFCAMALVALAAAALFSTSGARGYARALAVVGVAVALVGIVQQPLFTGKIYGFWTPIDGGSPYGPFVNKNHFAGWMLMAIPVTLGLLFGGLSRAMRGVGPSWRDRLAWFSSREANQLMLIAAAAIVMALSLVLTMSRSGITALALALLVSGTIAIRRFTRARTALAIAYLVMLSVAVGGWVGADAIVSRFSGTEWNEFNGRRGAWLDATAIASRFPLAGTGLNTYETASILYGEHNGEQVFTEAHNDYLQLAAEGGWLLCVPAAIAIVAFAATVRRRFKTDVSAGAYWMRVGAVTGIVAIALQETVEFSLQMPGNAVLFAVLCGIALHRMAGTQPRVA